MDDKQPICSYFYNFLISLDGKKVINIRRMPIVNVSKETFETIFNKNIQFSNEFYDIIKNQTYCVKKNKISKKTMALFIYKLNHVVVEINDNLYSDGKCLLTSDSTNELIDFNRNEEREYIVEFNNQIIDDEIFISNESVYSTEEVNEIVQKKEFDNFFGKQKSFQIPLQDIKTEEKQKKNKIDRFNCLTNLNKYVKDNEVIVTGLDKELDILVKGLLHIRKPNVMIIGEPGVGKTALVEKLACAINDKKIAPFFFDKEIYELNISNAVAGTKYRGEFEEKMKEIIKTVEECPNIILFIDEAHTLIGAGGAEGAIDASNIFKPSLARGKIRVIGATTKAEYDESIAKDKALARRFAKLEIVEPNYEQVTEILKGIRPKFEKHYNVEISDEKLKEIQDKSKKLTGMMPDVAIDELEDYCVNTYYNENSQIKEKEKESVR